MVFSASGPLKGRTGALQGTRAEVERYKHHLKKEIQKKEIRE